MKSEHHPLSPATIVSGLIIAVLGGVFVAWLIGEGSRFTGQTTQAVTFWPPTQVIQQVVIVVTATPQSQGTTATPSLTVTSFSTQLPTTDQPRPIVSTSPTISLQNTCSTFTVGSTPTVIPTGMWVTERICSPLQSACFYTVEQSSGGQYSSNEHNEPSDRRWNNAFCSETEAKNFANKDAKAMLQWWPATNPNPFP